MERFLAGEWGKGCCSICIPGGGDGNHAAPRSGSRQPYRPDSGVLFTQFTCNLYDNGTYDNFIDLTPFETQVARFFQIMPWEPGSLS